MGARKIIFYWLLLLIPTLLIGGMALRLLKSESQRLEKVALETAEEKARLAVDGIRLTVNGIKETLTEELLGIDAEQVSEELWAQEEENPFVRNIFLFSQDYGVLIPNLKEQRSPEKIEFIRRYESLFNGRRPWFRSEGESEPEQVANNRAQLVQEVKQAVTRSKISYGNRKGNHAPSDEPVVRTVIPPRPGWKAWIWEDQLYLLGFIHDANQQRYYGIEMELITLLTRLYDALPREVGDNEVFVLRDKNGRIFHQRGSRDLEPDEEPAVTVNVGTTLPHFEIAVFGVDSTTTAVGGLGFFTVSSLLVGTFVMAIIIGGSLLILQAHRNIQDARQKTNFVSNVSHELKTPLTTIRMYAELLGEGRVTDEEKKSRYMGVIVDESQRLTRLVDNVLDFSRLEQGGKKYRFERIPLCDFMRHLVDMQRVRMEKEGIALQADCDVSTDIEADRDALEQVVLNLVDNAVKYARDGGELAVQTHQENGHVCIDILDRGPGVPREQQKRIFEKFHRVDDSLTAAQAGSGLGLSIACRLVEDMGGNLEYEDRAGGGAKFSITLPAQNGATEHGS